AVAVVLSDLRRAGHCPAPYRSASLCALRQAGAHCARRPDPGGAARRFAGGQFFPGRRYQGHLGAGAAAVLSRIADHLYWMSRYLERAENTVRMLDVTQTVALMPGAAATRDLTAALQ